MSYTHAEKFDAGPKQNRFNASDITKAFQIFMDNPAGATGALKTGVGNLEALIGAMSVPWGGKISMGNPALAITGSTEYDWLEVPYDMTLLECELVAKPITGQSTGSIVLDFYVDTYANWPPTGADSIVGAGTKPTISDALKSNDANLSDYTRVALTKGEKLVPYVVSCTNLYAVQFKFKVLRTGL